MASQWPAHLNRECPRDPHFKATGWPRWPPRRLVLPLRSLAGQARLRPHVGRCPQGDWPISACAQSISSFPDRNDSPAEPR